MSYSSESLLSKLEITKIMKKFGSVSVSCMRHKRFKSNEDTDGYYLDEYLFCLKMNKNEKK